MFEQPGTPNRTPQPIEPVVLVEQDPADVPPVRPADVPPVRPAEVPPVPEFGLIEEPQEDIQEEAQEIEEVDTINSGLDERTIKTFLQL